MLRSLSAVFERYHLSKPGDLIDLGSAGGFSGARLWNIETAEGTFCLRRWPKSHPDRERLGWMHRVLRHALANECSFVAAPIINRFEESFVQCDGHFWELTRWMPGTADFSSDPNDQRLQNMMQALASFHRASAQVQLDFGPSANIQSRIRQLHQATALIQALSNRDTTPSPSVAVETLRQKLVADGHRIAVSLLKQLRQFENMLWPLQPVIRDIWHDHVLFSGDEVTGIVDFGAMQMDSIAFDIARLLGSMLTEDRQRWDQAFDFYTQCRPVRLCGPERREPEREEHTVSPKQQRRLTENEVSLIPILDQTNTLLGSLNWLKWILLENRRFEDDSLVEQRIHFLAQRFQNLI